MLNFCNNHDNWRMQTMAGAREMRMCLAVINFWAGIPLHYAGDEQDLSSPGIALDGWSREELAPAMAWQAVPTGAGGNPADRDNFDMTSASYRYIQRLNALRRAYLGAFGQDECDALRTPPEDNSGVLIFIRGCEILSRVAVVANFDRVAGRNVTFTAHWPPGTRLRDALAQDGAASFVVAAGGAISAPLPPAGALVLVPDPVRSLPPALVAVLPGHAEAVPSTGPWRPPRGAVAGSTAWRRVSGARIWTARSS